MFLYQYRESSQSCCVTVSHKTSITNINALRQIVTQLVEINIILPWGTPGRRNYRCGVQFIREGPVRESVIIEPRFFLTTSSSSRFKILEKPLSAYSLPYCCLHWLHKAQHDFVRRHDKRNSLNSSALFSNSILPCGRPIYIKNASL
jgi:hypothetical protein